MKRQVTKEKPYMANNILSQKLTNFQENAKHFSSIGQTKMKKTGNVQCWQECGESGIDINIKEKKPNPALLYVIWPSCFGEIYFFNSKKSQ